MTRRALALLALAAVTLAGCGRGAAPGIGALRPAGAPAAQAEAKAGRAGTLLYGAFIQGVVTKTRRVAFPAQPGIPAWSTTQVTVDVQGDQPHGSAWHGKLVFSHQPSQAATPRVGDTVRGFVSYVTVDEETQTFVNADMGGDHLHASAHALEIIPAGR